MKIEIDQSGKIEDTSKPTVIAGVGKNWQRSVFISAREKRKIQKIFRQTNQTRIFISKLFAVLIFYLIKDDYKNISVLIIDREYVGHEKYIKDQILGIILANGLDQEDLSISFKEIGKSSKAHGVALHSLRTKTADRKLTIKDILLVL